jgi:hypothetical protein
MRIGTARFCEASLNLQPIGTGSLQPFEFTLEPPLAEPKAFATAHRPNLEKNLPTRAKK